VIEVLARDFGIALVARGEPHLRPGARVQVIRGTPSTHFSRHPTRLQRVGKDIRPLAGHGKGQDHIVQLGFGVGPCAAPGTTRPGEIVELRIHAVVHSRTQIHEPLRLVDQGGQNIRSERVDGEHIRQAVHGRCALPFAVADSRVVNHCIEGAQPVDLAGDLTSRLDARQVANDYAFRAWDPRASIGSSLLIARVEHDFVACSDHGLRGHFPESIGRASDEYPCHAQSVARCGST
jgi:hypothetical protein